MREGKQRFEKARYLPLQRSHNNSVREYGTNLTSALVVLFWFWFFFVKGTVFFKSRMFVVIERDS